MEKWIKNMQNRNYAKNTITTYINVSKTIRLGDTLNRKQIIRKLLDQQKSPNTRLLYIAVAQQYYKFYKDKTRLDYVNSLKRPRKSQKYFKSLSKRIIEKKLIIKQSDCSEIIYWKYILLLLFQTGIRASELKNIINVSQNTITILGKGNKVREIFCKSLTINKIIELQPKLFPYSTKTLRIKVKKYLGKDISPHTLRRSFATHMLKAGANPKMVQLQLGHTKIETTFSYLHLSYRYNKSIYDKFI